MRTVLLSLITMALALGGAALAADTPKNMPLSFKMKDIDGHEVDLAQYKGQVALLVNTASKCGFTPQYEGLEALYEKYSGQGFTILAFPANNFKAQEPGTDSEIKQFCSMTYNVTFPLFSKVSVKGEDICPLYAYLTSESTNPGFAGEIPWNFTKFLLDRQGRVVARFTPQTAPDDSALVQAIEKALTESK